MIKPLDTDFSKHQYDKTAVSMLSDYFNINVAIVGGKSQLSQIQWFENLSLLAQQNLGLAHCVVHNQTARGAIDITCHNGGSASLVRPYANHVGAFSFAKGHDLSIRLNGQRLVGKKTLASGLHNSDYFVFRVFDKDERRRWVFLDLTQVEHKINRHYAGLIGLQIANPYDMTIDAEIPAEWILDEYATSKQLRSVLGFHNYALITNYWAASRSLIAIIKNQAQRKNHNLCYGLLKLENQVSMLELLWKKNISSIFEPRWDVEFWKYRSTQYTFGKQTLIDVISYYLQIANSSSLQLDQNSQVFRDCLTFSSHITSLYSNLEHPERFESGQCAE